MSTDAERRRRGPAGLALACALALGAAVFVAVAVSSIHRTPGIGGWLGGIFGGFFVGLLVAGAGAWAVMAFVLKPTQPANVQPNREPVIGGTLQQTLDELEAIRQRTRGEITARATWRIPLCMGGGVAVWIFGQFTSKPGDLFDLLSIAGVGGAAGYVWASQKLSDAYRRLYKGRVLPQLAAQFGALTYRQAAPDLALLRKHRLFDEFDNFTCEDEIVGEHRGLPISIVELRLTHGSGDNRRTVFDGLLTTVTLPRNLTGTTVLIPDRGAVGNLRDRLLTGSARVRLEDPQFEKVYEVYGTDQIGARMLLTPAFMERFLKLAESGRFGAPLGLVEGAKMLLAMPKGTAGNLFEPPSYRRPATARDAIRDLSADIEHVLAVADAVIDLDYAARSRAADSAAEAAPATPPSAPPDPA